MNIFEKLEKKGICYAVCVGLGTIKYSTSDTHVKDYYIIIMSKDRIIGFYETHESVLIHTMNKQEVATFKSSIPKYTKVQHDKNGRVYELKDFSFKNQYRKWKNNTSLMS